MEARALVKSLKRIAMSIFGHDVRQLMLVDNMSVCLAFDRSRARNFPLLVQIRRFASYCLARNIQCSVRWIPSELNNSDSPSLYYSDEPSKLLTDAIPGCKSSQKGEGAEGALQEAESRRSDSKSQAARVSGILISNAVAEEAKSVPGPPNPQSFRGGPGPGSRAKIGCDSQSDEEKEERREQFKQYQFDSKLQGEEVSGQLEGPSSATIQAHGGPDDGGTESIIAGKPRSDGEYVKAIFSGAEPVYGFCQAKGPRHQGRDDDGWYDGGVSEPSVPARPSVLSSGSLDCSGASLLPRVWKDGSKKAAEDLEGHTGLQKAYPWEEPQSIPLSPLVCHGGGVEEAATVADVSLPDVVYINLCSALGIDEGPSLLIGQAPFRSDRGLVNAAITRRAGHSDEDRRIRHKPDPGFTLPQGLGRPAIRRVEERPPKRRSYGTSTTASTIAASWRQQRNSV